MVKTRRKKTRKTGRSKSHKVIGPVFLVSGLSLLLLAGGIYLWYLDREIQQRFSGNKWTLPARVYARPTELYIGKWLPAQQFRQLLEATGYSDSNPAGGTGRFRQQGARFDIHTRAFSFWDGDLRAQRISVTIRSDHITEIQARETGKPLAYLRLEPQLIGKIYPLHNEDRVLVPYDRVPLPLVDGLIAVEDRHFFAHHGIDLKGIARAFIANFRSGGFVQGGSTLTQQLVKNFFLTPERTLTRKFNEMIMALILEYRYNKAEIMSAYINEVYLGQDGARGVHGFGTAAEFYYGKPLEELSIAQIALLVGLVKGASYYNPYRHPERALQRRNLVLEQMHELGFIEPSELKKVHGEPLSLKPAGGVKSTAYEAFLDLVRVQLLETYDREDLRNAGLRIFTTLDPVLQVNMQSSIQKRLQQLESGARPVTRKLQAAAVVTTVDTGEVLALSGSRFPKRGAYNRALNSRRPIGSLIKPFIYLEALSSGRYQPLSMVEDAPVRISMPDGQFWQPQNYSGEMHGRVTLLEALARSYNLATVNLGLAIGLDRVIKRLHSLGIKQNIKPYPSLLLGTLELSALEVTQLYQVLASGGFRSRLQVIREVLTKHGKPLQKSDIRVRQVVQPRFAAMLNAMLRVVVKSGTARLLQQRFDARLALAGKTGTTNDLRDSWYAGFGANYLGVVWIGKDDNSSTGLTGATGALRVWGDIMLHVALEAVPMPKLPGLKWIRVKSFEGECAGGNEIALLQSQQVDPGWLCH